MDYKKCNPFFSYYQLASINERKINWYLWMREYSINCRSTQIAVVRISFLKFYTWRNSSKKDKQLLLVVYNCQSEMYIVAFWVVQ